MYGKEKQIFTFKKLETGKRSAKLLLFDDQNSCWFVFFTSKLMVAGLLGVIHLAYISM